MPKHQLSPTFKGYKNLIIKRELAFRFWKYHLAGILVKMNQRSANRSSNVIDWLTILACSPLAIPIVVTITSWMLCVLFKNQRKREIFLDFR